MPDKREVRDYYKKLRSGMAAGEVSSLSELICAHIIGSGLFSEAEYICAYAPLGNEVNVMPVAKEAWREGREVAFPKVYGEEMRYFKVASPSQLVKGAFGVREPSEDAGAVPADRMPEGVLVLVPGVAFDRTGVRMGFGKGYYDRHFAGARPDGGVTLLGVAYGLQVADRLPSEPHDMAVRYLVTEEGMFRTLN